MKYYLKFNSFDAFNAFEYIVCEMVAILSRSQHIKSMALECACEGNMEYVLTYLARGL